MKTILVPTDFSPAANNAVDYAIELSKFFDARIILLNAYPIAVASYDAGVSLQVMAILSRSSEERLAELKNEIREKHHRSFDIQCLAEMGNPSDVIEEVAKRENADLVVMGIVGEASAMKENIMGSTAITVARNKDLITFIIPEKVKYREIKKISFACDLDKTEETDLVYVARFFSKVFDAELEVVNVNKPEEEISVEKAVTNLFVEQKLDSVKHQTIRIYGEDVAEELENYFSLYTTDVLMLNPKKHNPFHYIFHRSITKELVFHSKLPILAIH